jgi:hypothetical protein
MTTKTKAKGGELPGTGSAQFPMPADETWPPTTKGTRGESLEDLESAAAAVERHNDDHATIAAPRHPVVDKPEWCLVLSPDGDYPTLEIFPNVETLTKRMRVLEDQDVYAFPFFGIPIPFTAGPNRFLQLPNGEPYPVFVFSGYGKLSDLFPQFERPVGRASEVGRRRPPADRC